jgi:hypothetical protein
MSKRALPALAGAAVTPDVLKERMADPITWPCGDDGINGRYRGSCRAPCCIVPPKMPDDEDSPKWKKSARTRSVCLCVCLCVSVCVCLSVVREHCGKHATLGRLADRCLPHPSLESSRFSDVRSISRNKLYLCDRYMTVTKHLCSYKRIAHKQLTAYSLLTQSNLAEGEPAHKQRCL